MSDIDYITEMIKDAIAKLNVSEEQRLKLTDEYLNYRGKDN